MVGGQLGEEGGMHLGRLGLGLQPRPGGAVDEAGAGGAARAAPAQFDSIGPVDELFDVLGEEQDPAVVT